MRIMLEYLSMLSPTLNLQVGDVKSIPLVDADRDNIEKMVQDNIDISKEDWDSFETSWDFQHHSLLRKVSTISEAFDQWQNECEDRFNQMKDNEEELNRIFIDIYGLQDELTPEVEDKDVTVRKADLGRDIRSFISYAVGCMFGHYSLDVDGLAYAGGEWDARKYVSFPADKDNIIPICDDEYFEDDIVGLFVDFVKTVYGAETLDENSKFIADGLGGKGQPKDVIRNYFLNEFYSDRCKIYQYARSTGCLTAARRMALRHSFICTAISRTPLPVSVPIMCMNSRLVIALLLLIWNSVLPVLPLVSV